ncbi:hypothetical protein DPMN_041723 [Dreissena polymorpha]|uniref:C1q domain-containing protein n=1 Tax=Dreissena polymorpha TaxID=45954 RepID=A0A9D4CZX5_DREPO|nr:hypothetical protein DPMN_041723 [Dreissena polymorpha]
MATLTTEYHVCAPDAPIIFDRKLLDTRMSYDIRHGIFCAPVNGTYVFTATLSAKPGTFVHVKMVKRAISIQ